MDISSHDSTDRTDGHQTATPSTDGAYPTVERVPGAIPSDQVVLKLWGDAISGYVNDEVYLSNEAIHMMVFSLPPGGRFLHSERSRTYFGADEIYYVLTGTMFLANPETGEVHRVEANEAVHFGPNVWHHGFNGGGTELRVLELFAPPPATGTSQAYARARPNLDSFVYTQDEWLEAWPRRSDDAHARYTQKLINSADALWRLEGKSEPVPVGIWLSTERLTVAVLLLMPGQMSDVFVRGGDQAGYLLEGQLNVHLTEAPRNGQANGWHRLKAGDGLFVPAGEPHRYFNVTDKPARLLFGVAPSYRATDASLAHPGANSR
jgi:quercetin dioxygenase-like cupin family protein